MIKVIKNILLIIVLLFSIGLTTFCITSITKDILNSQEKKEVIKNIQDTINYVEEEDILEKMKELYNHNNDLAGYIIIPDTNINFPVMYTGDDFYLRRSFSKTYSMDGTPYIDKHNKIDPRDTNLIIYGHNMKTEKYMFYELEKYLNQNFYENHKTFTYYTLEEKETYEIVAVFLSKVYRVTDDVFKYYKFYNSTSKDDMEYFNNNIKELRLYDTGIELVEDDQLITLSTCEDTEENGRLVVVARKIKNPK